ncbi:MAG: ABC transporter permease subunit [Flavobacteriales bacterium]|nr:ABC transporter permease subunit [Flavobacteriales bacterium]
MSTQIGALRAEFIKNTHENILWLTFVAFGIAPVIGGVFMVIMRNPDALANAGALSAKAAAMNFTDNWGSYFGILTQAVGVGGVMVFGFVASWVFGREYTDGTAKDLLSLPTSRTHIIHSKFFVYVFWCLALVVSNLLIGFIIGTVLHIQTDSGFSLSELLSTYFITGVLTLMLGTPIAFFAMWGKGYLAPLAFVALTLVFSQIIAAVGFGAYFPWAIPGLYSGAAGEYRDQLDFISYSSVVLTFVIGYALTVRYWKYADQTI